MGPVHTTAKKTAQLEKETLQLQLIKDCKERAHRLNIWENEFISDLDEVMSLGIELSEKRHAKLEAVWEKATEEG